jgi:hypothetical protein
MLLLDGFARRPPPELAVLPLDATEIAVYLERRPGRRAA